MKSKLILLFGMMLLMGCSADEYSGVESSNDSNAANGKMSPIVPKNLTSQNKVLLLKVDYLTQTFEGGKQLVFPENPSFNLTWNYQPPIDFGSLSLIYADVGQPIFEGTIHWMGLGQMQYPEILLPAASFGTTSPLPTPALDSFLVMYYDPNAFYPDPIPLTQIWDAIKNLQVVTYYRSTNPNAPIRLFLYTPSVGVGNPADWDYFVILKN